MDLKTANTAAAVALTADTWSTNDQKSEFMFDGSSGKL